MSKILSCEINVKKQICRKKKNELPDMEIDMGQGHRESGRSQTRLRRGSQTCEPSAATTMARREAPS